ncbi:MAG: diguanylate cyclase [Synergistaceae bacterium]|jgi:diguanylate cyclase (GGDEF)-like protein|nr:diguanylate cyclase [Synergistaceae bacterium]
MGAAPQGVASDTIHGAPPQDILFEYLRSLIYSPANAKLDIEKLPESHRDLGKGLMFFGECVLETTALAKALSKGDLNCVMPSRSNEMAAPLKALHATLRHLTWQARQVAKGDYKQRVSFMGEFADSFNTMIEQLEQRRLAILEEIMENIRKSEALAQNNSLLEAITGNISQWIVVIDKSTKEWLYVNKDLDSILADAESEPELRAQLASNAASEAAGREKHVTEFKIKNGRGVQYFSVVVHPLQWYEHDATAFVLTDVSSEKRQMHRLENVAYHDTLTKVFNRHYGMNVLTEWLGVMSCPFVICFADMDHLKYVNDKFGHSEGDKYILRVTEVLRSFSKDAILCRLGGDEFMLLAQNWTMQDAEARLESLREKLKKYNDEPGCLYHHSVSYGVVEVDLSNTLSASELLGMADEKMYRYKRDHKMQRQLAAEQTQ